MISYEEAMTLIDEPLPLMAVESIALSLAKGRILADDIVSTYDHPFFDCSAVDGYGIRFSERRETLKVEGEMEAGSSLNYALKAHKAVRIFTGAPIPTGVDTVVMQELVQAENGVLQINDEGLKLGANIRKKGGQLKKGAVTLTKGSKISAAGVGFLASIGQFEVSVYKQPQVAILVTGNEFLSEQEDLQPGKIYDSNGVMLQAALQGLGIKSKFQTVKDELATLQNEIESVLENSDMVIITGGVSVGDYDFTKTALGALDFETIFHKVKQKPGKPILFTKRVDGKIAFGLPGNPQSAMIGFYLYVWPVLNRLMGAKNGQLTAVEIPTLQKIIKKDDGKTHFIPGRINENGFEAGTIQASHMLLSLANANAIAILTEDRLWVEKGALITCKIIK